jgi:Carbohydrate phosphorylase
VNAVGIEARARGPDQYVAKVINGDPVVRDLLRVVFLPDYKRQFGREDWPRCRPIRADFDGGNGSFRHGNMKFALNGALTIGTFDGASIEIREHVGAQNIFIFGLRADEVEERRRAGLEASSVIASSPKLAEAIGAIETGADAAPLPKSAHYRSGTRKIVARGGTTRLISGTAPWCNVLTAPSLPTLLPPYSAESLLRTSRQVPENGTLMR